MLIDVMSEDDIYNLIVAEFGKLLSESIDKAKLNKRKKSLLEILGLQKG